VTRRSWRRYQRDISFAWRAWRHAGLANVALRDELRAHPTKRSKAWGKAWRREQPWLSTRKVVVFGFNPWRPKPRKRHAS